MRVIQAVRRAQRQRQFRRVQKRGESKDFLFVSGPAGGARRYRCDHQAEQLALRGLSADVGYWSELELGRLVDHYDCVVLYRVPWDERVEQLLGEARRLGKRVVADVDDLVFDPGKAGLLHELSLIDAEARRAAEDSMARLGRTLSAVDGVVVSTEPLAAAAARLNASVAVAPNVVSSEMIEAGRKARARRAARRRDGEVVAAYLSGTATHDRDFLEAADAVLSALDRHPNFRFWAVGFLALDERFDAYGDRVVRIPYQPWRRLPSLLVGVDVNLAPLERANEFTDAKSCVKYLEAGVVGVPTLASTTSDFRRAIESGVNGLLAGDPVEWRDVLARLVELPDLRRRLGDAALEDVLSRHTTAARAAETHRAFLAATTPPPGAAVRNC